MRISIVILLVFLNSACFSQSRRIAHWYFGYGAGLDFSGGALTVDITGNMASLEGSAAMSDESGRLLFYSNGERVWNRNHAVMPHGAGIKGDQSSTQSTLIVPLPGNNAVYYLFSSIGVGTAANTGVYYNVIDMNLDQGLGDIDLIAGKDIQIMTDGTEQLAGTFHCNAIDYWIVGRQKSTDSLRFYAWLLTKNGLAAPVISSFYAPNHSIFGTLTFSPDGGLAALSAHGFPYVMDTYLLDFDIKAGVFAMKSRIAAKQDELMYSNALSPDKTKLYISSYQAAFGAGSQYQHLSQFDLTAADITASRIDIDSAYARVAFPSFYGQLRLGPDQQVYVSRSKADITSPVNPHTPYSLDSLDVIHSPNATGLSCRYQKNYLWLQHQPTMLGLPGFISNYTSPQAPVPCLFNPGMFDDTMADECKGMAIRFSFAIPRDADSIKWDFGDPSAGAGNHSMTPMPVHEYTRQDEYSISLTVFHDNGKDTVLQKRLAVHKRYCEVFMPSAFSPNGDGHNDVFRLIHGDNITRFNMNIYNRWGQQVFSSADKKTGWDGLYHGIRQPPGIYAWNIIYDTPGLKNKLLTGTLTLIR
jgi:gliding motility-associated-like protein